MHGVFHRERLFLSRITMTILPTEGKGFALRSLHSPGLVCCSLNLPLPSNFYFPSAFRPQRDFISPLNPILSLMFVILSFLAPREAGSSLYSRRWPPAQVAGAAGWDTPMSEVSGQVG